MTDAGTLYPDSGKLATADTAKVTTLSEYFCSVLGLS